MDFRPQGAWRVRTDRIRAYRRELFRSGDFATLNRNAGRSMMPSLLRVAQSSTPNVLTGTVHVPVVLIAYSNVPVPFPIAQYHQVLFTPNPASLEPSLQPQDVLRGVVQRADPGRGRGLRPGAHGHDQQLLRGRLQRHRGRELLPQRRAALRPDADHGRSTRFPTGPAARPSGSSSTTTAPMACPIPAMTTASSISSPSSIRPSTGRAEPRASGRTGSRSGSGTAGRATSPRLRARTRAVSRSRASSSRWTITPSRAGWAATPAVLRRDHADRDRGPRNRSCLRAPRPVRHRSIVTHRRHRRVGPHGQRQLRPRLQPRGVRGVVDGGAGLGRRSRS